MSDKITATSILTTALAAIIGFGFAATAVMAKGKFYPMNPDSVRLLETAKATGVKVVIDPGEKYCPPKLFGFAADNGYLVVCYDNHTQIDGKLGLSKDEANELADTIRHELVHIVQYCAYGGNMILPENEDYFISRAQDLGMPILSYETHQWATEAEARVLAHEFSEIQIAFLLTRSCRK